MKKWLAVLGCILMVSLCAIAMADIEINGINFPDENFRNCINCYDLNHDRMLSDQELAQVTTLSVRQSHISNLKGIEYFTALKELYCWDNNLTELDVSSNTALTDLTCQHNQLTTLDLSHNPELAYLFCYSNQLEKVDVSQCPKLKTLSCENNQLKALDVSGNKEITIL